MKKTITAVLLLILGCQPAFASGPAAHCVSIGSTDRSQKVTNRCNRKIEVIWCHNYNRRGYSRGVCGRNGKYYQKHTTLEPGKSYDNRYSLPLGSRIYYGACFGGYYTAKQVGNTGKYRCKNRRR